MRGMFWNSIGLGDLAKHKHIADCVKDHALDFVATTESGKHDFHTYLPTIESRASNIPMTKGTTYVKIFVEYVGANMGIQVPLLVINRDTSLVNNQ